MKTVTQKEIARKAKVSVMTVSRVINNEKYVDDKVRKRIWSIIKSSNYSMNVMARGLRTNKVNALGIILRSGINVFAVPYFSDLLRGFEQVCIENGYDILLGTSEYRDFQFQRLAAQRKAAAYMIIAPSTEEIRGFEQMGKPTCPYLMVNSRGKFNYLDTDNSSDVKKILLAMIKKGYKKIGFIKGPELNSNAEERFQAFSQALEEAGMTLRKEFVWEGLFDRESGEKAALSVVAMEEKPDAVFAANDLMAIGFIQTLRKCGVRIPQDIAVAGYDNIQDSLHLQPPLTTIDPQTYLLGEKAAKYLLEMVKNPETVVREVIPSQIISRESFSYP